jgi:uncharacterized protein (TIGR02265 family)
MDKQASWQSSSYLSPKPSFSHSSPLGMNDPRRYWLEPSPAIMARGSRVVSAGTVMLLIDGCKGRQNPQVVDALWQNFGFDCRGPALTFPYDAYVDIAEYLRQTFHPNVDMEVGFEEMGYRIGQGYFNGMSGQIMKKLARVMGPQSGAKQFVKSMKKALAWGEHEILEVRPGYVSYRKRLVGGPPPLMLGLIRACLEAAGAKLVSARYTIVNSIEDDIIYEIEWA